MRLSSYNTNWALNGTKVSCQNAKFPAHEVQDQFFHDRSSHAKEAGVLGTDQKDLIDNLKIFN